ncbi:MAG: ABC transporter ATP-binding protein [Bacteroidetes bacterium GWF2_42_66]|nr:MAG: ABC transporter ATP-binding protein [Bacteroidetes bacterium GWE2_42_39]OFY46928.1 MAG: ABC transporter ATP-binding protein [Bacteroidetes bacterium GWF2_42_66]HBL75708.1 ABC transporter ATP-binding protein [Prolixibacteraceae bacterium]HCR91793.1 ABC transporter ATP-binding protein [Prolixibacteraceae bacterium]HCU59549.1 ABC transporter ATP-binding protein [Prolixibacteraceae bacterium]
MKFIVNRRVFISMLFVGLTLMGIVSYNQLKVELFPNVELPFLYVQASYQSEVDPKFMENQIIIPIEGAIGTLEGVESIESNITARSGNIVVYYQKDVNFKYAYLKLQEKINGIQSSLPEGARASVNKVDLQQLNSQFMELQVRGSGGIDRVRNITDQEIAPDLENIDGIASVKVFGGREKSLEIILDPGACEAYDITPGRVRSVISQNSRARTYVGNLKDKNIQYFVHVTSEYENVTDIENLVVADGPVLLKDIAEVHFGVKEETSYSRVNGKDAVTIQLVNDSQANLIDLSDNTKKIIGQLNEKLGYKDIEISIQSNSAETMEKNIDQIIELALVGGILAIFVLWIFLKNIRIVAFIALAIPISVYTAFNLFYAFDITLNSLTLVGMALAVGMLLDNSVVVLENIYRLSGKGYTPDIAVTQGSSEVWRSIVAATMTTVAVFLPFLFSSNPLIEMLGYNVGVSIVSTLLVSLAAALLLVPMGTYYLLKRWKKDSITFEKVTTNNRMVQVYMLLLKSCMRNPATTIIGATAVFFITIFISLAVSVSSLQEVEQTDVSLYVTMPSGSSLEKTDETVADIESKLEDLEEKLDVVSKIEEEEAIVTVKLKEDYEDIADRNFAEIKADIEKRVNSVNTAEISFEQTQGSGGFSGGSRNSMGNFQRMMGIGTEEEKIVLKGQDFAQMQQVAEDFEYYLDELESIRRVRVNVSDNRPEVHMIFDPLLMTEYNLSLANVTSELNSFQKEISTGVMFNQDVDEYEIIITTKGIDEEEERNMEDLRRLQVTDANDGLHDLQDFSNLVYASGMAGINRVNQEKSIEITYSFVSEAEDSKDLLEAYRYEIDELVASYNLPSGVAAEVVHEESELDDFYFLIGAAVLLIFMILASVFESLVTPFVLMFTIPLAGIGSFMALIFTGNSLLNANTLTGFLILIGIVVNNGIILIDYTNILRERGFRRSRALMTAGLSRVRPILITAIATIVAMIPLGMGDAEYVSVIGAPFAIIVIGGLAVSTLLTLIFIPTMYSGLESSLEWFRNLSWKLKIIQFSILIAGTAYIYFEIDSGLWQVIDFILLLLIVPGATWFVLSSLKKAKTKLVEENAPISIVIQNLVKIYDRPDRFTREWNGGINIRKRAGLEKEYKSIREFDHMIWQLPLLGFFIYFTFFYLESALWILFMTVMVYLYINGMWKPFNYYLNNIAEEKNKRWPLVAQRWVQWTLFWILPLPELFMLWKNTKSIGLLVTVFVLWYLALIISVTSRKLYEEKVNIDRITGRFGNLRRTVYRLVKQIPVIGKRRQPFKALNGVSLKIETGMFGLLGPNGAGKSTMMRTICGIFEQSYGKIWINGIDTQEKREELQGLIGYLPQEFGTYENMPAEDFLDYQAILKGLTDKTEREERVAYVLKSVHMYDRRQEKIGSFSGGMKQRIGIAQILLHLPRILVVDEPTAGLDPRERIRFRNLLVELSRERIVIFSTHIIEDIASSCNQVAVINRGRVKYTGTPSNMVHLAKDLVWQFDVPAKDFDKMPNKQMVIHHMRQEDKIRVRMLSKTQPAPDAVVAKPLLEDAYLCLIKDLK